ncbi:hypothetical protein PY254_16460 [Rhodanobacter sp. AS-Z3]|uniref:hypothetical protein n=1 Tax=Rhodanobacter sp. AS-Z3 TaxID=3031330 RepID=UPI00247B0E4B|nr:hypothetical protein [Rhodanobacter sp. AS-Z3]WEN14803.1 hypothetical protein PY254_16460 [Rhodanobacter sp. AS-Z3]
MKLQIFVYQCEPYGHAFQAPELPLHGYGEFLLRTGSAATMSYLDALADPTYKEVDALLARRSGMREMKATKRAEILRNIYGQVACDPDGDGTPFRIGQHPRCPVCSSSVMRAWQEAVPTQFVELDIPAVTHALWTSLSDDQKVSRINQFLPELQSAT